MMTGDNALGAFLRARRALLEPADFDLPDYGRRRVKGLRREELAMLAGVSPHYYARLERGSDRHPSPQVIDALAQALRLDEQGRAHLREIAAPAPPARRRQRRREKVAPGMEVLMARWHAEPAVVIGRYRDVLAATPVATLVNPAFAAGTNLLRHAFLDPTSRDVYPDWEAVARGGVAGLRASAGADASDSRLTELVGELSVASEEFRQLWARHDARERTEGSKRYLTQLVGPIALEFVTFSVNGADGQTLYVFYAEPGSEDEHALAHLAAAAAQQSPVRARRDPDGREAVR
jgi:transcriptional regulator with XRE-family HTH domain